MALGPGPWPPGFNTDGLSRDHKGNGSVEKRWGGRKSKDGPSIPAANIDCRGALAGWSMMSTSAWSTSRSITSGMATGATGATGADRAAVRAAVRSADDGVLDVDGVGTSDAVWAAEEGTVDAAGAAGREAWTGGPSGGGSALGPEERRRVR